MTLPRLAIACLAAVIAMAGCRASGDAGGGGTVVLRPLPGDRPVWLTPGERAEWRRHEMMAILALPESLDTASVRITLNGEDVTERFLPAGFFPNKWAAERVLDRLHGEGARFGDSGASPEEIATLLAPGGPLSDDAAVEASPEDSSRRLHIETARRMLALFHATDLRDGPNRLTARWSTRGAAGTADPRPTVQEETRTFTFRRPDAPSRTVTCRVSRVSARGTDLRAGARILIEPLDGAAPVDFTPYPDSERPAGSGARGREFVIVRDGAARFFLPEGKYRAIATGGPLDSTDAWTVPERGDATHDFTLRRVIDPEGIVTADFHVHSAASADSRVSLDERVHSFLAGGVDVLVASDHDHVTDYGPALLRTDVGPDRIRVISGVEATIQPTGERSLGHWNVWPLDPDPAAPPVLPGQESGGGALPPPTRAPASVWDRTRLVAERFDAYRRQAVLLAERAGRTDSDGAEVVPPVIQLNHPRGIQIRPGGRLKPAHDFFGEIGFDPDEPLGTAAAEGANAALTTASATGTTSLDFDAIEIWNRSSPELYRRVRRDWFALLSQGIVRTGVANTDTHNVSVRLAGYPMNIVFLPRGFRGGPDTPVAVLAEAVRGGHVVGTDGPVPLLQVGSGKRTAFPGELLEATASRVQVRVRVVAVDWIPAGPVRIWANGRVVHETVMSAASGGLPAPMRAAVVLDLPLTEDTWILAEAGDTDRGDSDGPLPGLYGRVAPTGLAVGFTNPVLVDVDGNGRYDPPGLTDVPAPGRP